MNFIKLIVIVSVISWVVDRLPPVKWLWTRFIAVTDKSPFWAGAYPEMRLGGVAFFFIGLPGVVCAFLGEHFRQHQIGLFLWGVGGISVILGVALGFYSFGLTLLRYARLRRNPEIKQGDSGGRS